MGNLYHASMSDGSAYHVTTDRHHDNHDEMTFKQHLLEIIKASIPGIISGVVVGFVHKGRK